jgi:hypothetical protein
MSTNRCAFGRFTVSQHFDLHLIPRWQDKVVWHIHAMVDLPPFHLGQQYFVLTIVTPLGHVFAYFCHSLDGCLAPIGSCMAGVVPRARCGVRDAAVRRFGEHPLQLTSPQPTTHPLSYPPSGTWVGRVALRPTHPPVMRDIERELGPEMRPPPSPPWLPTPATASPPSKPNPNHPSCPKVRWLRVGGARG